MKEDPEADREEGRNKKTINIVVKNVYLFHENNQIMFFELKMHLIKMQCSLQFIRKNKTQGQHFDDLSS